MPKQKFRFAANTSAVEIKEDVNVAVENSANPNEKNESVGNSALIAEMMEKLEAPTVKTPLDSYKLVPRNKLRDNKKNHYPILEMESLKDSILRFGLVQDICAIYITDEDMYAIEAGHRRRRAIDELIEEFSDGGDEADEIYQLYLKNVARYENGYVVKVMGVTKEDEAYDALDDEIPESAIDSEIRLIITNEESRPDNPVVKAENIQRLAALYERKNMRLPKDRRININQKISEDMNMSARSIAYYKGVDKLIPELKEEVSKGNIGIVDGAGLARLPQEEQEVISRKVKDGETMQVILKEKEELKRQLKEKEAIIKKYENESAVPSPVQELLKVDMRVKTAIDQATGAINTLVKNIAELNRLKVSMEECQADINVIGEEELSKSKKVLIELLS